MNRKSLIITISFIILLCSCKNVSSSNSEKCIRVELNDHDFRKIGFSSLPDSVKKTFLKLALVKKNTDTALSLQNGMSYSYENPGDGKGYTGQVLTNKHMHIINGKCFEFLLYAKPYIIYQNEIYCLSQNLSMNCSSGKCVPDTNGLYLYSFYSVSLSKVLIK